MSQDLILKTEEQKIWKTKIQELEKYKFWILYFRYSVPKEAIKIHLVSPTQVEGKNGDGCPLARWVRNKFKKMRKYMLSITDFPAFYGLQVNKFK